MKFLIVFMASLLGTFAHAACLDISGSYEIAFGMPECAAGTPVVKAWRKFEQTGCQQVSVTKVYKLEDGSFCEGMAFRRTDDGQETHNEGSDYASTYKILQSEHVSKVRHLTDSNMSFDVHYTLDQSGNLVTEAFYRNGAVSKEYFVSSPIR